MKGYGWRCDKCGQYTITEMVTLQYPDPPKDWYLVEQNDKEWHFDTIRCLMSWAQYETNAEGYTLL